MFGNVFEVTSDGETRYSRGTRTLKCQKISSTSVLAAKQSEHCEEEFEEYVQTPCNHETLRFKNDRVDCRLFAINRDLTAYEYVHRFTRNEIELTSMFDKETSAIFYGSPRRPALRRLITFEPVGSESRLKNMLSFPVSSTIQRKVERSCVYFDLLAFGNYFVVFLHCRCSI